MSILLASLVGPIAFMHASMGFAQNAEHALAIQAVNVSWAIEHPPGGFRSSQNVDACISNSAFIGRGQEKAC